MKVLIVDDSKAMRMRVARALRHAGFDVEPVFAENGQDGLEKALEHRPGLILSDWNMPDKTGLEFLTELRELQVLTPFVFVTSEGTQAIREAAQQAGAERIIQKPFSADQFAVGLAHLIR